MSTAKPTEIIDLDGLLVSVMRSTKRRTLSLEVGHEGVKARVPERLSETAIRDFVSRKRGWIERNLSKLPAIAAPLKLEDGSMLGLLGKHHPLRINSSVGERPQSVYVDDQGHIVVSVSKSHLPLEQSIRRKLVIWYKKVALQHLAPNVKNRVDKMLGGTDTPKIKVRDYKRRWGSCDHRGNLSFNWRLAMAPETVIEYVIVHEIAHLLEFNHSPRFWKIVQHEMPDWREQQQWLRHNGSQLYRF